MHRIDTPTAQKDKFGAGKNGFTRGNPQTGTPATDLDDDYFDMLQEELAGIVEATGVNLDKSKHNQLLTALKALFLSRDHPFADIKADGAAAVAEALSNLQLREAFTGIVGTSRNVRMSVTTAAATATLSADELIVEDGGGRQYRLTSFSKTVNLATTGAGGMDSGAVPTTGFVALYSIYNPTSSTSALLAVNATSATAPELYGGSNMPAGYTASALVSVWGIASSLFIFGEQCGRNIAMGEIVAINTTSQATSYTSLSIAGAVPRNAKTIGGWFGTQSTTASTQSISVSSSATAMASRRSQVNGALAINGSYTLPVTTPQTIYYQNTTSGTLSGASIVINEYSF